MAKQGIQADPGRGAAAGPLDFGLTIAALEFAARQHRDQRRKGADRAPYINHPIALLHLLWTVGGVRDPITLAAALLHDTVEDTPTTATDLVNRFGVEVAAVVAEVTDNKNFPKLKRKQIQIERAANLSDRAKLVKLADKICNIEDVTHAPPTTWPVARRRQYLDWAKAVVEAIGPINGPLGDRFERAYHTGLTLLDREPPSPTAAQKLYVAAPLFSAAERAFNAKVANMLRDRGYQVFLPQDEAATLKDRGAIFRCCLNGLKESAAIVAILDGADADSGTCWECGYGYGAGIPVVAVRTDFRLSGDAGGFNAMLAGGAASVVVGTDRLEARLLGAIATALNTEATLPPPLRDGR
jgi:guanosine-3',5'-bis(diphosphate) 3'-pyrophosphohydrolase